MTLVAARLNGLGEIRDVNPGFEMSYNVNRNVVLGERLVVDSDWASNKIFRSRVSRMDRTHRSQFFNIKKNPFTRELVPSFWLNLESPSRDSQSDISITSISSTSGNKKNEKTLLQISIFNHTRRVLYANPYCIGIHKDGISGIHKLLSRLGVKAVETDFIQYAAAFCKKGVGVSTTPDADEVPAKRFVAYGSKLPRSVQIFSLMHECAHHMLGHIQPGLSEFRFPDCVSDVKKLNINEYEEHEARNLAYEMLVPTHLLLQMAIKGLLCPRHIYDLFIRWHDYADAYRTSDMIHVMAEQRLKMFHELMGALISMDIAGIIDMTIWKPWISGYREMLLGKKRPTRTLH